ncbi:MAG: glycosyltransferase family 2 protein [Acidobacteria bacterium]|nr:glycosyltransferase family 2 protein [Acidobacteriota bacterium]MBI3423763.1 glycosyltransferase family 2 protein [Acidobacteriota bacterium]
MEPRDSQSARPPALSVVLPVYGNRAMLPELYRRLCAALVAQSGEYELIFVNDACPQGSLEVLKELAAADARVAVLALARNQGQHCALLTGLRYARGACVVMLDADLQDPPETIPALLEKLAEGYGAVYAGRSGRYESGGRLLMSRLFKGLLHVLVGLPVNAGLFVALSRPTIERLLAFAEPRPYVTGMIAWLGRPVAVVPIVRAARPQGVSAYTTWMRVKLGVNAVWRVLRWRCWPRRVAKSTLATPLIACIGARFTPAGLLQSRQRSNGLTDS